MNTEINFIDYKEALERVAELNSDMDLSNIEYMEGPVKENGDKDPILAQTVLLEESRICLELGQDISILNEPDKSQVIARAVLYPMIEELRKGLPEGTVIHLYQAGRYGEAITDFETYKPYVRVKLRFGIEE